MIKKNTAVIVGLTSLTLFAGCLALINNDDNQKKVLGESFNQAPPPQFSDKVALTDQSATKFPPPEQASATAPVAMPQNTPATPLPTEQPATATPDVKMNPIQTPTQSTKVVPSTTSKTPTPSIRFVPSTTSKTTTTRTRAS